MKPRVPLRLVSGAATASAPDPMLVALKVYERESACLSGDLSDEEVGAAFARAVAPLQATPSPIATTRAGAIAALKAVLAFESIDPTDTVLVRGALAYLERGVA